MKTHKFFNMMKLVEIKDIPLGNDVPIDDLLTIYKTCQEMEFLCRKENGIGLSAVQVGLPLKLFILQNRQKEFDYYINTDYKNENLETIVSVEGCLSIRSVTGQLRHYQVDRYKNIIINGFRLNYKSTELKLEKVENFIPQLSEGIVFQHEIEHQKGILISDNGNEIFLF